MTLKMLLLRKRAQISYRTVPAWHASFGDSDADIMKFVDAEMNQAEGISVSN